jgi:hypothetical protein
VLLAVPKDQKIDTTVDTAVRHAVVKDVTPFWDSALHELQHVVERRTFLSRFLNLESLGLPSILVSTLSHSVITQ